MKTFNNVFFNFRPCDNGTFSLIYKLIAAEFSDNLLDMQSPTEEFEDAVVIDNGSGVIKAGIAGNEEPSTIFSNLIGCSHTQQVRHPVSLGDCWR